MSPVSPGAARWRSSSRASTRGVAAGSCFAQRRLAQSWCLRSSACSRNSSRRAAICRATTAPAAPEIYGGEIRDQPELIRAHSSRIVPPTTQGYLYQLLAGLGWTSLWWLHRLRQPTLILAGSDDRLVPPINARLLALLIPNNRLHIIPGGGHLFMLHRLDDVVPLICEFLDRPAVRPMRSP